MPYIKLAETPKEKRDSLKAELLERMTATHTTNADMADAMHISRSTFQRLMKTHTDDWTVSQIKSAFRAVKVRISLTTL